MKLSAKARYACKAIYELAAAYPSRGITRLAELSQNQDIPLKYLVQILGQLRRAGLVESRRGAAGGYSLMRTPAQISLGEVLTAVEGPLLGETELRSSAEKGTIPGRSAAVERALGRLKEEVHTAAYGISFEEIVQDSVESLTYQI
ncbi:MAG: Rrf2 family transcriptional regulator [Candidatus Omnitrophica bacterium]|nr:Rrf2 family transcriptional regulator [Candidatus Omnitrophota bacterium]